MSDDHSDPLNERVTASERVYLGRIMSVRVDTVELADGRIAVREVVEHAPVVAIVPVDADGNVILVRQYRLPAEDVLLEIPAGGVDPGESVEGAAQRELREETGCRAGTLDDIGGFYVSPGYVTEFIHLFLARDLTEDGLEGDADEQIEVVRMPLAEAVRLIDMGEINDGKTILGLLLTARQRGLGG
ncbi:MAG: NUDIX hydrolase [Dehalococcoidia bacterium]